MKSTLTLTLFAALLPATSLFAQSALSGGEADAILKELRAIRQLLERGAAAPKAPQAPAMPQIAPTAKVKVDPAMVLGNKDAPLTIVEYTDAQCGFCKRFHSAAFAEIRKKLIDTGKVRFVSRDMPLDAASISLRAAEAIRCAGEQDKYWPLRDAVMSSMGRLTDDSLTQLAQGVGIDTARLNACVATGKYRAAIQADVNEAASFNIGGTPSFIIGKTTADGVDGVTMMGALGFEAFEAKLREVEGAR